MNLRQTLRQLIIRTFGSLPWYAPMLVMVVALPAWLAFLLSALPARAQSMDWVEASRGQWLRAVRHVPTGRCFVRYTEGGVIETNADVCGP